MTRKIRLSFCTAFLLLIMIPLLCVNLKPGGRTTYENRALKKFPVLFDGKGIINEKFLPEFANWFEDHIGFRDSIIQCNGVMQYYLFHRLDMKNIYFGPNEELASIKNINDYQHTNLMDDNELRELSIAITTIRDYLASFDCQFYLMQCWDKHSIYPEQYPLEIHQYDKISRAEQVEQYLSEHTDIHLVRIKDRLIEEKENYAIYGKWSEPWHWNPRGSMVAYQELMNAINKENDNIYKVLGEDDFLIEKRDEGRIYYGVIHHTESTELFRIKKPLAVDVKERLAPFVKQLTSPKHNEMFMNKSTDNKDKILIYLDSYIHDYPILQAIAESFCECITTNIANVDHKGNSLLQFVEEFHPNIVLFEMAERGNWSVDKKIIKLASEISLHDYNLGTNILFSKNKNNSSKYILRGLSKPEKDFTWMEGKNLVFLFNLKNVESQKLRCKLSLAHVFRGKQPVTVTINDKIVYSGIATENNGIEFSFQNPNTYSMRIEITAPEASSQAELGIGQNKTILPLAIREMKIFE